MKHNALASLVFNRALVKARYPALFIAVLAGFMGPLGFAPFHMPGLIFLSLAVFYSVLLPATVGQSIILGFVYGLGFFGLGVSWVIFSIHDYGQMNYISSGLITLLFICYLSLYPSVLAYCFYWLKSDKKPIYSMMGFAALWCISEYLRSRFMTGFPWLLVGSTQIDTPLKYLAPVLGIYGLSFITLFASALLYYAFKQASFYKRSLFLASFVMIIVSPALLKPLTWTQQSEETISIGAVQGNLSMRDKWDDALFWRLLKYYEKSTDSLLGKRLIIFPESAIPLPARYLTQYLSRLHHKALDANSAILLGILHPSDDRETHYYNAINAYGKAFGQHLKRHLVPFGEYIPAPVAGLNSWFNLPEPNIIPGNAQQNLISIFDHPIASLICYEIAYPELLRQQLPRAEWIVSISDNGWFGHSFASYQQLQMSQMLSIMTGRFQVVVNNDGLSSVIDSFGNIVDGLPAFSEGLLESRLSPSTGSTPWVIWGDWPVLFLCFGFLVWRIFLRRKWLLAVLRLG